MGMIMITTVMTTAIAGTTIAIMIMPMVMITTRATSAGANRAEAWNRQPHRRRGRKIHSLADRRPSNRLEFGAVRYELNCVDGELIR